MLPSVLGESARRSDRGRWGTTKMRAAGGGQTGNLIRLRGQNRTFKTFRERRRCGQRPIRCEKADLHTMRCAMFGVALPLLGFGRFGNGAIFAHPDFARAFVCAEH